MDYQQTIKNLQNRIEALEKQLEETRALNTQNGKFDQTLNSIIRNLPGMGYRCLNDENWTMEFKSAGKNLKPDADLILS